MTDSQNPSASPVAPGDVLAGKYRVDRVLGVGGMGVVVAATHLQLHQSVAIKFALPAALQNQQAVERFLREARAAVRLKSEHVAKVLDVGTLENNAPYMVMEYLDGVDLHHLITQQPAQVPIEAACDYILQACEALAEAHTLGIIHRDLKPGNLFLTQAVGGGALIKVLDFGISKMTQGTDSALTRTTAIMGSPLYMAPEQMRSARNVDPRTDIWALGVILYELLTARVPFEADAMPELCLKVVNDPPDPIANVRTDVPDGVLAIVYRCLEKAPADRYQNAAELATALEPFAPQSSRAAAERARSILSSTGPRLSSLPNIGQTGQHTQSPARTASNTDAGFEKGRTGTNGKSKTGLILIAGIVAVAAGAAVAVFLTRGPSGSSATNAQQPPANTLTSAPEPTKAPEPKATTPPPPTTTTQAPAVSTSPPAVSTAPAATVSAAPTTSAPATAKTATKTVYVPATTKTAQPQGGGDGIPDSRH